MHRVSVTKAAGNQRAALLAVSPQRPAGPFDVTDTRNRMINGLPRYPAGQCTGRDAARPDGEGGAAMISTTFRHNPLTSGPLTSGPIPIFFRRRTSGRCGSPFRESALVMSAASGGRMVSGDRIAPQARSRSAPLYGVSQCAAPLPAGGDFLRQP